jgi:predicted nucleotidyltransferase
VPDSFRATLCGDASAEARIHRDLLDLTHAIQALLGNELVATVLLGGYARGEGSIVEHEKQLGPYNDYDLVVVVRSNARAHHEGLRHVAESWSKRLGVEVDVWPVAADDLNPPPRILLWLDAALGGARVLAGDEHVLDAVRRLDVRDIPLGESGRLLANRAVGLALSNLEADHDLRRARHGHKMILALGDVYLLAANRYAGTLAARMKELDTLGASPAVGTELVSAYQDAIAFRARPDLWKPATSLDAWYEATRELARARHLSFEAFRVGSPATPLGYATFSKSVYPEPIGLRTGASIGASIRARIKVGVPLWPYAGHPRERLARVAMLLAYEPQETASREKAAALLGIGHNATDQELHERVRALSGVGG